MQRPTIQQIAADVVDLFEKSLSCLEGERFERPVLEALELYCFAKGRQPGSPEALRAWIVEELPGLRAWSFSGPVGSGGRG